MTRLAVTGELNPDLILSRYSSFPELGKEVVVEDSTLTMGSASAICAMGLARLGNKVSFVSKVGTDTYGDFCVGILCQAGIDVSGVDRDPAVKTGITVSVSGSRDRALVSYLGATLLQDGACITRAFLSGHKHLHISSFFLQPRLRARLGEILSLTAEMGLTTSLDPGFDPSEQWDSGLHNVLRGIDVFLPNEVEVRGVSGELDPIKAVEKLANGRTLTVAKLGAEGCFTIHGGRHYQHPAFPIQPVDTTGAGDSFNAGFLHAWLDGKSIPECLRFAAACGAISTLAPGGTGNQPTEQQAFAFLEHHRDIV